MINKKQTKPLGTDLEKSSDRWEKEDMDRGAWQAIVHRVRRQAIVHRVRRSQT